MLFLYMLFIFLKYFKFLKYFFLLIEEKKNLYIENIIDFYM